ncbi:aldose epimerase family protein [Parapedobacter sp. 10938]|uniref:aldose epimerase family protein n=1 Tax=Parapedobacter flavus TaxID=3110225 RepID=UPI002DBAF2EA|nr:aldose epimerase family protein [Parapedobacter sp. 10938]MEC3878640.1 aldose epimerase family protein [Parapedobacter sp. 10938]
MTIPANTLACGVITIAMLAACNPQPEVQKTRSGLDRRDFQTVVNGDSTNLYVIRNASGMEACITNYGGRIVSLMVPDAKGEFRDVVQGFAHIDDYTATPSSFGATMGRVANRIANGRFVLDGDTVQLDRNNGQHTIHGGGEGWRGQVFTADQPNDSTLVLAYISPDGESGFPGEVTVRVTFAVNQHNELAINYEAETTEKTVINLTNHSFFNLAGDPEKTVLDNVLYVNATDYTPLDSTLITTGEIQPVAGTPFDFTEPLPIRAALGRDSLNAQLQIASGIDHNFVLNTNGSIDEPAARLYAPGSGIAMEVYTTEPGMQVYTGNMLDGSRTGKEGVPYAKQSAICLETQHFPDAPNKPHWPTTVLEPGDTYTSTCIYRFSVGQ